SIEIVQNPPVIIDTIKTNLIKIKGEENKEPVKTKNSGQQIFAENFGPYKDESMDPASRSGNNLQPFEKFQLYYWEGNAKNAYAVFDSLKTSDKQNDNLRFLYANVLMSLNKTQEASLILNGIIQNHKSIYSAEAKYYLALCNIKAGKIEEAQKNLKTYLADGDAIQISNAKKILKELD
ncbi:MAG: CDC27 family protein, partial [Saprospiraceae bacterium]